MDSAQSSKPSRLKIESGDHAGYTIISGAQVGEVFSQQCESCYGDAKGIQVKRGPMLILSSEECIL